MFSEFVFPLVVGFLGSLHCLGMCGPLVSTLTVLESRPGNPAPRRPVLLRSVNFAALHGGRLFAYGAAGALAALLFQAGDLSRILFNLRSPAMLLAGLIMLALGLHLAGVPLLPGFLSARSFPGLSAGRMARLLTTPAPWSRLLLGGAFILIPCCLTWAMVVTAAATLEPVKAFFTMVSFGIGSAPALILAGTLPWLLPTRIRLLSERIAALAVAGAGIVVLLKGAGLVD